jgi:hypothetical protein
VLVVVALPCPRDTGATPGTVLTSTNGFAISGSVSGLAAGVPSTLMLTATNSFDVPITVTLVTVSVPSPPVGCPLSNLSVS